MSKDKPPSVPRCKLCGSIVLRCTCKDNKLDK